MSSLCLLGSPSFWPPSLADVLSESGAGFPRTTIFFCQTVANVGCTTFSTQSGTLLFGALSAAGGALRGSSAKLTQWTHTWASQIGEASASSPSHPQPSGSPAPSDGRVSRRSAWARPAG